MKTESYSCKIRMLRAYYGYTQEHVAFELDVSQKTYSNIEADRTAIKLEHLEKLCLLYKISLPYFFTWNPISDVTIPVTYEKT